MLALDSASWHSPEGLAVSDGVTLVFLPFYSPELQPAERLWPQVDELVANKHFGSLADFETVLTERCTRVGADAIRPCTSFHCWLKLTGPK